MEKIIRQEEQINRDWKIRTSWTKDEQIFKSWIDGNGLERIILTEHYIERIYELIHIPENRIVKTFQCSLHRTSVGDYEQGPDYVYFSEDGTKIVTEENYGTKVEYYKLNSFIKKKLNCKS